MPRPVGRAEAEPAIADVRKAQQRRGLRPIGDILGGHLVKTAHRGEARLAPRIAGLIVNWSGEWQDQIHLRSNLTQARHIKEHCGWSDNAFVQVLYEAHATTQQDGASARRKMAYFYAVLKDLVGLKEADGHPVNGEVA